MAQLAAQRDAGYEENVRALQEAQPKDLTASEIDVRLGATWIDAEYIEAIYVRNIPYTILSATEN